MSFAATSLARCRFLASACCTDFFDFLVDGFAALSSAFLNFALYATIPSSFASSFFKLSYMCNANFFKTNGGCTPLPTTGIDGSHPSSGCGSGSNFGPAMLWSGAGLKHGGAFGNGFGNAMAAAGLFSARACDLASEERDNFLTASSPNLSKPFLQIESHTLQRIFARDPLTSKAGHFSSGHCGQTYHWNAMPSAGKASRFLATT